MSQSVSKLISSSRKGSVLIFALWALAMLGLFAAHIGISIRGRASLIARIEMRSQLHFMAEAGVKKAIAALNKDFERNHYVLTAYGKSYRYNNEAMFKDQPIAEGKVSVGYDHPAFLDREEKKRYGIMDEEGKLNINTATADELMRLLQMAAALGPDRALEIAQSLIEWRAHANTEGIGATDAVLSSGGYYEPKHADFEVPEELLLVSGVTPELYERLEPFITIYGNGQVNINTASAYVLRSLGLSDVLVDKILSARRGPDNSDDTADDHIFNRAYDMASEVHYFVNLIPEEAGEIDRLNAQAKLKTSSIFYRIESQAVIPSRGYPLSIKSVFDSGEGKIVYWREKF